MSARTIGPSAFTKTVGVDPTWLIIADATDAGYSVWNACPGARPYMLEAAAIRRWESFYQHTSAADWLAFARWLTLHLDEVLASDIRGQCVVVVKDGADDGAAP